MRTTRRFLAPMLLCLSAGMLGGCSKAAVHNAADRLEPCHVPGVDEEVLCGRYEVYEDRAAHKGRKIGLNIVVLPARDKDVAEDPLVFLAGGGVAPATGYAGFLSRAFPNLRRQRDILLVDQRGTGGSNPLECELSTEPTSAEYRDETRFLEAVRRCRSGLERSADLRWYTTPIAMDDLDDVREWLGYQRLNLYGVSYGTKAAMVYVRQHPGRVRALALQGIIPLDVPMWLEISRSSQQALDQAFSACARQPACHAAFPDLEAEFSAVLERLTANPVKVRVSPVGPGPGEEVTIDGEVLRVVVLRILFSASRIHDLPLIVHLAHQGDYELFARKASSKAESGIPKGIYLSIVCSEQIPQFDRGALSAAATGTFLGGFRIGREVMACGQWVRGWLPEGFETPVKTDIPALVMTGALDHVTPPGYAEHLAQTLTNARQLVLPGRGHNDVDPCVTGTIEAFLIAGKSEGLDTTCLTTSEGLSFALSSEQLLD